MGRAPQFGEADAREAIAASSSWAEALRHLAMRDAGSNHRTLQKHARLWSIPTDHFDPNAARRRALKTSAVPLADILVEHSSYHRGHLKRRLYAERLKQRACELCGQGELWRGRRMALILDHINGVATDNRLSNLQIVCPNCAATLDTHCGRGLRQPPRIAECLRCKTPFEPRSLQQRYCSQACAQRYDRSGRSRPSARKVERPPYEQLVREIEATSYSAVGRRHGVSDNAVRKWVRQYLREAQASAPG